MKNKPFHKRIGFALAGISEGWRAERSFRSHVFSTVLAVGALALLRPPLIWCALVTLVVALVLAAELFNAALEALVDHLHPALHPRIGVVKDMAAGAVLITALASLIIAGLLALEMF